MYKNTRERRYMTVTKASDAPLSYNGMWTQKNKKRQRWIYQKRVGAQKANTDCEGQKQYEECNSRSYKWLYNIRQSTRCVPSLIKLSNISYHFMSIAKLGLYSTAVYCTPYRLEHSYWSVPLDFNTDNIYAILRGLILPIVCMLSLVFGYELS